MEINDLRVISTVVAFLTFVGIVVWAYSSKRKQGFEEAALQPLLEDDSIGVSGSDAQVIQKSEGN
jgi:cytochrome c oxidase cbb3-type subunit 4